MKYMENSNPDLAAYAALNMEGTIKKIQNIDLPQNFDEDSAETNAYILELDRGKASSRYIFCYKPTINRLKSMAFHENEEEMIKNLYKIRFSFFLASVNDQKLSKIFKKACKTSPGENLYYSAFPPQEIIQPVSDKMEFD